MSAEKQLMVEAAVLYYEKKHTQQEIAQIMKLTRQTVSRLLSDAVSEQIVEIRIHDPEKDRRELEEQLCARFAIRNAVVCAVSGKDDGISQLMTVKKAAEYLTPILERGGQKIALSWGRTLRAFIAELPRLQTKGNTVFPLFGATDSENACFLSNELARGFADKIGAEVKYAWFPYRPDQKEDCELLKRTSYYKKMEALWGQVDLAIVGIGNTAVLEQMFQDIFGHHGRNAGAAGDIATHLFDVEGNLISPYDQALCAPVEALKNAGETVAIACSSDADDKVDAILGALRTGLVDTLITDEHTTQKVLKRA